MVNEKLFELELFFHIKIGKILICKNKNKFQLFSNYIRNKCFEIQDCADDGHGKFPKINEWQ